jgi:hypothetical protein
MKDREYIFTVAPVGSIYSYPGEPVLGGPTLEDHGLEVPYEKRRKIQVAATNETTFGEIIDSAIELGTSTRCGCGRKVRCHANYGSFHELDLL